MKAVDVRNRIIDGLHGYLNIPVILAEQVSPESEPPYMIYSITAPYIPGNILKRHKNAPFVLILA